MFPCVGSANLTPLVLTNKPHDPVFRISEEAQRNIDCTVTIPIWSFFTASKQCKVYTVNSGQNVTTGTWGSISELQL